MTRKYVHSYNLTGCIFVLLTVIYTDLYSNLIPKNNQLLYELKLKLHLCDVLHLTPLQVLIPFLCLVNPS